MNPIPSEEWASRARLPPRHRRAGPGPGDPSRDEAQAKALVPSLSRHGGRTKRIRAMNPMPSEDLAGEPRFPPRHRRVGPGPETRRSISGRRGAVTLMLRPSCFDRLSTRKLGMRRLGMRELFRMPHPELVEGWETRAPATTWQAAPARHDIGGYANAETNFHNVKQRRKYARTVWEYRHDKSRQTCYRRLRLLP
jgi:hypothetical protein